MNNFSIEEVNELEYNAYEHYSSECWEKAIEKLEILYSYDENNSYTAVRLIFLHWYLSSEFGVIGYKPFNLNEKLIWHHKRILELYAKSKVKFENESSYLWILGYMIYTLPDYFCSSEFDESDDTGKEYIRKALKLESDNKLILLTNIDIAKENNVKLNKENILLISPLIYDFSKKHGILGSLVSEKIRFNIFLIHNNYTNPLLNSNTHDDFAKFITTFNL